MMMMMFDKNEINSLINGMEWETNESSAKVGLGEASL